MATQLKAIPEYLGKLVRLNESFNTIQTQDLLKTYSRDDVMSAVVGAVRKYNHDADMTGCTLLEKCAHEIAGRTIANKLYRTVLDNFAAPKQGGYKLVSATKIGKNSFENLDDKLGNIDVTELVKDYSVDNVSMPDAGQDVVFMTYKKERDLIVLMYQNPLQIGAMIPTDLTMSAKTSQ